MIREKDILEKIADTAPIGILVFDKNGKITYANSYMRRLAEERKESILNRFYSGSGWKAVDDAGNQLVAEKLSFSKVKTSLQPVFDNRVIIEFPPGKKKYVSVNSAPRLNDKREFDGVVSYITDISELKESEEKFKTFAEQSIFGIIILQDGKYKYVNQRFAEMTNYTIEEMMNWSPLDFLNTVHPEDKLKVTEQVQSREKELDKGLHHYQFRGIKKTNEIIWVEIWSKPIIYNGRNATFITVGDITDKKETEEKYHNAYNRAEFYKDLFAHDINNILQNVKSANDILKMIKDSDDFTQKFEEIHQLINNQVDRGAKLVSNIRKLSKLDEEEVHTSSVDLFSVLKESTYNLHKSFVNKKLTIKVESAIHKVIVLANEFLSDVFDNILLNAVKHNSCEFIEITVIIKKININNTPFVQIHFVDNGIGIPDEKKNTIFRRDFYTKRVGTKGMGLGLSLVKKIIESYHGEISVDDKVKGDYTKGSVFSILIREVIS